MTRKLTALLPALFSLAACAQGPTVIQHATTADGGTSVTLPFPPRRSNLLIAAVNFFSGYPLPKPVGWTLIGDETNGYFGARFFFRIVGPDEPSSYDFPSKGDSVVLYEISQYNPGAPIHLLAGSPNGIGPGSVTTTPGIPTTRGTLALAYFAPDVQTPVTSVSTGWTFDGCDYRQYHTLCSATRQALTTSTTDRIQTSFSFTGPINGSYTALVLVAPGPAGTLPLPTPTASVSSGTYASTQTVALSSPQAGASLHYTLDDTFPTCTSPTYKAPLTLDSTSTLRALACDASGSTSILLSTTYVIAPGTLKGMALGPLADLHGFKPFASSTPDAWQTSIADAPVDQNSAPTLALMQVFGMRTLYADTSIPYQVVDSRLTPLQPFTPLADHNYLSQSDVTLAPFPTRVVLESNPPDCNNDGDHHAILLDRATGFIDEFWHFRRCPGQTPPYQADNLSVFDLLQPSSVQRPFNYTSADAGGLSVFQGLGRYDEFASGKVQHALRLTLKHAGYFSQTGSAYGYYALPAKHSAATNGQAPDANNLFYYGMRLRLKAGYSNPACTSTIGKAMIATLQQYGLIFADLGNDGQVQFTPDSRWSSADTSRCFNTIPIAQFDLVQRNPVHYGVLSNYPLDPRSVATNLGVKVRTPIPGDRVPVIQSVSATPGIVAPGQCSTLSATFTGGSFAFWNLAGPIRSGQTQTVCPAVTTTYKLTVQAQSLIGDDGSGDGYTNSSTSNGRAIKSVSITVKPR